MARHPFPSKQTAGAGYFKAGKLGTDSKAKLQAILKGPNRLPDELVARIKRDLRTRSITDVARMHNLRAGRIRDIHLGITYDDVEPAP